MVIGSLTRPPAPFLSVLIDVFLGVDYSSFFLFRSNMGVSALVVLNMLQDHSLYFASLASDILTTLIILLLF